MNNPVQPDTLAAPQIGAVAPQNGTIGPHTGTVGAPPRIIPKEPAPLSAAELANLGENCRLVGDYSRAIASFTKAIAAKREGDYPWAYAHRGAARAALGNFAGAWQDFQKAEGNYQGSSAAWLHAQKGELCRLWARASLSNTLGLGDANSEASVSAQEDADFQSALEYLYPESYPKPPSNVPQPAPPPRSKWPFVLMSAAIARFSASHDMVRTNAWVLAHRGAVYTMRYWIDSIGSTQSASINDFNDGCSDFAGALDYNPTYGWAQAFWGVLYALNMSPAIPAPGSGAMVSPMDLALAQLTSAQMNGMDRQLSVLRVIMELYVYHGANSANNPNSQQFLEEGGRAAWEVLQLDSDETFARYFVADALSNQGDPEAPFAVQRARMALSDMSARILAMDGALDCLEIMLVDRQIIQTSDPSFVSDRLVAAAGKLQTLKSNCDLEALSLVKHDPAWAFVLSTIRDNKGPPPQGAQALTAAYNALFQF